MVHCTAQMLRRFPLVAALLCGIFLTIGCSGEGEGTVAPPKAQGNKARLEKIQSKVDALKSKSASK
jgi:hypothetical protein